MYEIWLMMNVVWEILLTVWPMVLALLICIGVLAAAALARGGSDWRGAWRTALVGALVVAVLSFLALPGLTRSSLGELKYWVDWLALAGVAAGFGAAAAALLLPLTALLKRPAAR
ncbi:MAG: hypothetical protein H6R06_3605 [Proteobacteria bacterium]|jgi:hypothetical protein|nr:hypothetical protein [Pseudomonadota bacterium]